MRPDTPSTYTSFPDTLQQLAGIRLDAGPAGQAFIAAQGAQVLSWRAKDGRERLYLSDTSSGPSRDGGDAMAIRGGVPVCFPQFSDRGNLVKHGFARTMPWRLDSHTSSTLNLTLRDDAATQAQWPHPFKAQVSVHIGPDALEIALHVVNAGNTSISFTAALHTYLRVGDIGNVRLRGLHGIRFQDATDNCTVKTQDQTDLAIPGEVDRVYLNPPAVLQLLEQGQSPLTISQQGFADTVVWNPGPERARALVDMPDDDWMRMLCVEAACAAQPVRLAPGAVWQGSQRLSLA